MSDFTMETGADGVAVITWDVPGKSMNIMSLAGFAELDALTAQALGDPAVKGIVITSGKKDFAAGMDLNILAQMREGGAARVFDELMQTHRLFRRIELAGRDPKTGKGGKPVVAALPGTALGIGLELPLATHRIIAADNPRAKIGLPEINVGIFPGAGGTTRLVRRLGLMGAAPFLMEGKLSDPKAALAAGIIDEVVAPGALLARAREWVLAAGEGDLVKPWDARGYRMPGGAPYSAAGYPVFLGAVAMVHGRTQGVFPAAKGLLGAVYEGALVPFDQALRIEARHATAVLTNPSSEAMIRTVFVNRKALEKGARRPAAPAAPVGHLAVIGAGMMGAAIANVAAGAGIGVTLIDTTAEAAGRGKAHAAAELDKAVRRGRMTPGEREAVLERITPATDYAALAQADLVVEAVFEDPAVKGEVTKRAGAAAGPGTVLATNTSTLPITALARAAARPESYVGIHFFSPVEKMMLVEIIRGRETGDAAVARAFDFARQLGKTPIIVNDARFFYANRCIIPYINEGIRMVGEGVAPALIENAARLAGMPVGPLQLIDETSIDLGVRIAQATRAALGSDYDGEAADRVLFWMAEQGRHGRKGGAGFYDYSDTGERLHLWEGLARRFEHDKMQPSLADVQNRLLFAQIIEAVRALEDGILADIREGDVGAVLGWGFAPWSGGPFGWLDITGTARAVDLCRGLTAQFGRRFEAPALLREMAQKGEGFYTRFGS